MAAWWDGDLLTEADKVEWCAAAVDGLVAPPLADTVPPGLHDEWLKPVEPENVGDQYDGSQPAHAYAMSEDLVSFINASC
jgi:hypothetical protein